MKSSLASTICILVVSMSAHGNTIEFDDLLPESSPNRIYHNEVSFHAAAYAHLLWIDDDAGRITSEAFFENSATIRYWADHEASGAFQQNAVVTDVFRFSDEQLAYSWAKDPDEILRGARLDVSFLAPVSVFSFHFLSYYSDHLITYGIDGNGSPFTNSITVGGDAVSAEFVSVTAPLKGLISGFYFHVEDPGSAEIQLDNFRYRRVPDVGSSLLLLGISLFCCTVLKAQLIRGSSKVTRSGRVRGQSTPG